MGSAPSATIVPTWLLPGCRRSREIWEALFQLDRCDCRVFSDFGARERERGGGNRGRISRIFQSVHLPKPIIEINGLKIIQAFLLKKERERKRGRSWEVNWLFKARPNPTTYTTKEEGLERADGEGEEGRVDNS